MRAGTIFWDAYYGPKEEKFYRENHRLPRLNEVLHPLAELDREMSHLENLRDKTYSRSKRGELWAKLDVDFLPGKAKVEGKSLSERVKQALTGDKRLRADDRPRFDVVHFAGHAIFEDDNYRNRGYLVFGDEPYTDMVPMSEFADWLRQAGVQMVYLSCCRSSAARAAFDLANEGIPLTIGFTWDLDSRLAADFADAFYGELLKNDLKVCDAFQSARRALSARHREDDPIWTSPVLVAQPEDWLSATAQPTPPPTNY